MYILCYTCHIYIHTYIYVHHTTCIYLCLYIYINIRIYIMLYMSHIYTHIHVRASYYMHVLAYVEGTCVESAYTANITQYGKRNTPIPANHNHVLLLQNVFSYYRMCSLTTATHPSLPMTMMSSPLMSSAVKISPKICLSSFCNTPRSRYERAVFKLHENQSAFIYHPSDYLHAYTHTRNVCMYVGACMHSHMRAMSVCEPATSRRAQSSVTVSHLVAPRSLASTACLNPDQTLTLNPKP
jgi:hypothetical protein